METRVLNLKRVAEMLGVSRSSLYRWTDPNSPFYDAEFPPMITIGGRRKGFIEQDFSDYLKKRGIAASSGAA
jgi:prophage regulatory protein